jgi:hypothetical protein
MIQVIGLDVSIDSASLGAVWGECIPIFGIGFVIY